MANLLIGLDVGGTKIAALAVDQELRPLGWATNATNTTSPQHLVDSITQTIQDVLREASAWVNEVFALGIGIPGQVNTETGEVGQAVNLNLDSYPLGEVLSDAFGCPVLLENDAYTAAMGAYQFISRQEPIRHMAYLSIGTGIAVGLILDGRLYRGSSGMAGEIGHITLDPNGEVCNCGARGCLETLVAGPSIVRQANAKGLSLNGMFLTVQDIYQAAQAGNQAAQMIVGRVSAYLGLAIQWLIMTYDVEKVVLGGGVASAGAAFLDPILNQLEQLRTSSNLARIMLPAHKVMLMPTEYNAATWGAIMLAQQALHRSRV